MRYPIVRIFGLYRETFGRVYLVQTIKRIRSLSITHIKIMERISNIECYTMTGVISHDYGFPKDGIYTQNGPWWCKSK